MCRTRWWMVSTCPSQPPLPMLSVTLIRRLSENIVVVFGWLSPYPFETWTLYVLQSGFQFTPLLPQLPGFKACSITSDLVWIFKRQRLHPHKIHCYSLVLWFDFIHIAISVCLCQVYKVNRSLVCIYRRKMHSVSNVALSVASGIPLGSQNIPHRYQWGAKPEFVKKRFREGLLKGTAWPKRTEGGNLQG